MISERQPNFLDFSFEEEKVIALERAYIIYPVPERGPRLWEYHSLNQRKEISREKLTGANKSLL